MRRPAPVICILISAFFATGCGDSDVPTFPVSGIVRLEDGTPVQTGQIELTSADGSVTARTKIGKDGGFSMEAIAGKHRAVIIQLIVTEDLPLHKHDHGPTVHPDFAHYRRSGLSFSVKSEGKNKLDVVVREVEASKKTLGDHAES